MLISGNLWQKLSWWGGWDPLNRCVNRAVTVAKKEFIMIYFLAFLFALQIPAGGIKTKLYIWGEVKSPGLYYVESNADILELISLAGGPTPDADLAHVKLVRGQLGGQETNINLGDYLSKQASGNPIFLKSGDIIIIKSNLWKKVRSAASFISNIVVFVNLYLLVQKL